MHRGGGESKAILLITEDAENYIWIADDHARPGRFGHKGDADSGCTRGIEHASSDMKEGTTHGARTGPGHVAFFGCNIDAIVLSGAERVVTKYGVEVTLA
jgi:hypothetical protein